ncbi:MAG: hypothetical protein ACKO0Z_02780 [Betaproteobacteria bacterium]
MPSFTAEQAIVAMLATLKDCGFCPSEVRKVIAGIIGENKEIERLRSENERLKFREKNCATENQAMLVAAVRFMQEAAAIVGMGADASPAEVLAVIQSVKHDSDSFHGIKVSG